VGFNFRFRFHGKASCEEFKQAFFTDFKKLGTSVEIHQDCNRVGRKNGLATLFGKKILTKRNQPVPGAEGKGIGIEEGNYRKDRPLKIERTKK
jgi:hypothetical protein